MRQLQSYRRAGLGTVLILALLGGASAAEAQRVGAGPNVLIVVAHPDDDAMFAATVYKITHSLMV